MQAQPEVKPLPALASEVGSRVSWAELQDGNRRHQKDTGHMPGSHTGTAQKETDDL